MERDILKRLAGKIRQGETVALVTLTESMGSAPRKAGSIMAVFNEDFMGSIGGGKVEFEVIKLAREAMEKGESKEFSYTLLPDSQLGMSCGGSVKGYIKVFKPQEKLLIVGAGHIGKALNELASHLSFEITVVDDRVEYAGEMENIVIGNYTEELKSFPVDRNTYCVIVTRGHETDEASLRALLGRHAAYIGMVGSKRKVMQIRKHLLEEGFTREQLKEVYSPIGVRISDGTPYEIAIEILAEILKVKNNGDLKHRRDELVDAF